MARAGERDQKDILKKGSNRVKVTEVKDIGPSGVDTVAYWV